MSATDYLTDQPASVGNFARPNTPVVADRDVAHLEFHVKAAVLARDTGDTTSALAKWIQILSEYPEDPRGYSACGSLLREAGRFDDAETILTKGITRFPNDEAIAVARAWVAHSRGAWSDANRLWSTIREIFPNCQAGFYGGGAVLRVMRRYDDADAIYRIAFSRFPVSSGLLGDFAAVAQCRGDTAEASRRWITLHTLFPSRIDGLLREAKALREVGLYSEASSVLVNALFRFPGDPAALVELAQIAQLRSKWSEALHQWEIVVTQYPGIVEGYLGAANALNELGRFADAQNVLQPAVRKFPNSTAAASLSAWTDHYRGHYSQAIIRWKDLRDRFPTHSAGYIGGAASLLASGKEEEASALLETARRLFPDDPHVATQWARVPQHAQNWEEAVRRWTLIFERFVDSTSVKAGYAWCLSRSGNSADAEGILQVALIQHPTEFDIMRTYAECAGHRSDWTVAENRWRQVVEKFPERANGWAGLGEALRNAGRLEDSTAVLSAALKQFPDNLELERHSALTATATRDWKVALPLWEQLKRKYPRNLSVRDGIAHTLWQARQDIGVVATEHVEGAAQFEIPPLLLEADDSDDDNAELRNLLMKFESIGDTCEFGIVQRRFGAEPISLLRWSSTPAVSLVKALEAKFDGVGDAENTIIRVSHGEYVTQDQRYHMFSHTFTPASAEPLEKFTLQHLRRMRYLREKLIGDLASGEKVFVYKSERGLSDDQARAIFQAIRKYGGRSALLCVRLEDATHPRGTFLTLEDGLFLGFIDRFSTIDINVEVWIELCKKTDTTWHSIETALTRLP